MTCPRNTRMNTLWIAITALVLVPLLGILYWLGRMSEPAPAAPPAAGRPAESPAALRIGLVPERDVFDQRRRYQALTAYIAAQLGRPVELVTMPSYEAILQELGEERIDGAFLGSLVAALALDRLDVEVLAKPQDPEHDATYCGVIFVPEQSPVQRVEDLAGRSIVMVKGTTAGSLFPIRQMQRCGLLARADAPEIVWAGTHDDVLREVLEGRHPAGAAKDCRIDSYLREHPDGRIRVLARSRPVPTNALVLRRDVASVWGERLGALLLSMGQSPAGRAVLEAFGATGFLPCGPEEYAPILEMAAEVGDAWAVVGVSGPPPRRLSAPAP